MNLANLISLSRILCTPLLLFFLSQNLILFTGTLYILLCVTDFLDGWVARRFNQETRLGQFLDPLADKIMVDLPLIFFVSTGDISVWAVICIIGREFFVTGLRLLAVGEHIVIAAGHIGKLKTVFQMIGVFLLIIQNPWANTVIWISVILAIQSGWSIWKQARIIFKNC